jgi:hypothetical protein
MKFKIHTKGLQNESNVQKLWREIENSISTTRFVLKLHKRHHPGLTSNPLKHRHHIQKSQMSSARTMQIPGINRKATEILLAHTHTQ